MKVAIITHYHNSNNYGGNLQAYALCKVLNNMGVEAEQLAYLKTPSLKRKLSAKALAKLARKCLGKIRNCSIAGDLNTRDCSINWFNKNLIPHTEEVYTCDTISRCVDNYDVFITGSDQVWHPIAYCPAYGLEFVPSNKTKISYAASIACDHISDAYRNVLRKSLSDFVGISVREQRAALLLEDIVTQPVHISLDPTLLLSKEEWDTVCSNSCREKPYLFCYFLGDSNLQRRLAAEYAAKRNLRIVTLPFLLGNYRSCDKKFGQDQLYDVSPADFISLIKGAEAVFTDSFHATVFSVIYEKSFVVFDRMVGVSMGSRLRGFMELINLQDRFCDTAEKNTLDYITSLPSIRYDRVNATIETLKADSLMYLSRCVFGGNNENQSS